MLIFYVLISIALLKYGCHAEIDLVEHEQRLTALYSSGVDCNESVDCGNAEICLNNVCIHACLANCLSYHQECTGVDHEAKCLCKPGFKLNHWGICSEPCSDSNPCSQYEECYMVNNQIQCECGKDYERDPYAINKCCLSRTCEHNEHCFDFEYCNKGKCMDVCSKYNCTQPNEGCITINHKGVCACRSGYGYNPYRRCEEECIDDSDCTGIYEECIAIRNFRFCGCKYGYAQDFTAKGVCRKICGKKKHCGDTQWCKDGLCVPCDGIMC